jgi:peptidoglycan/xylan/chitin deacetylase (PgdA/CDA1 family)
MSKPSKVTDTVPKRILKLVGSLAFYSAHRLWRLLQTLTGRQLPGTCVVLYYHAVRAEHRTGFASQMDVLLRCSHPIEADSRRPLDNGIHHAAVVFHDAFVSVFDNALPELSQREIPSTIFVPSGYLGRRPGWIGDQKHSDYDEMVIDAGRLRAVDAKLVSVGSHTVTHADLPRLSEQAAKEELGRSKRELEAIVRRPVELFAFPYGNYNEAVTELSKDCGYRRVFTIQPKIAFSRPDEYVTGSCPVSPDDWSLEFRLKLLGAYRWLVPLYGCKQKMVVMMKRWSHRTALQSPPISRDALPQSQTREGQDPAQ